MTDLSSEVFIGCTGLTQVTIGKSVEWIEYGTFAGCHALSTVYCKAVEPPYMSDESVFARYYDAVLYVPTQSVQLYKDAMYWQLFGQILGMDFPNPVGDVNNDGEVTIADANCVIDIVVTGGSTGHTPEADVNGDGEINIADVNAVIDIILSNN